VRLSWRHVVVLGGCAAVLMPQVSDTSPAPPEVIYRHGVVLTMDDGQPRAEAVAVRGGRVLAVGKDDDVMVLRRSTTRVVDLGGRTMVPGPSTGSKPSWTRMSRARTATVGRWPRTPSAPRPWTST
jgi:hypothetical protein